MVPKDEFESVHVNCFTMAIKRSFDGVELDTLIIKEFSKKFEVDFIDILMIVKTMLGEFVNAKR